MDKSKLHFYSFGRAANNLVLGETLLEVVPIEQMAFMEGDLASLPVPDELQGVDASGTSYTASVTMDTALEAEWLPLDSNRVTAPNVRRGERLLIWRFADSEEYYWSDVGLDQRLRRLETVTLAINANPEEQADGRDPANCYMLEISAHNKTITLTTTTKNGEFCGYAFQANLNDGRWSLNDDLGNIALLDSKETSFQFTNADTTNFDMTKKDINFYAPGDFTSVVEGDVTWSIGGNYTATVSGDFTTEVSGNIVQSAGSNAAYNSGGSTEIAAGGSMSIESGGSTDIEAGGSLTASSVGSMTLNPTGSLTLDAPSTRVTGNFEVQGTTTLNGGSSRLPFRGPSNSI